MVKRYLFSAILMVLISLFISTNVFAIPAFARRYKISCNTCHAPFPKLKPYGAEFAGNGFILKEEEKERDYVTAGDDLLWLNKTFPVAVRFDAFARYNKDSKVTQDLQSPWGVKLLSGGTLYKNIGYYFYFYMYEGGEVAGIEDAYIHFDNVFNTNLDIMVGQFQSSDPLMKRELRLTYEDYKIYKQKVGLTRADLTYDRGIMMLYNIEKTGTDIVGMLLNGNGKPTAEEGTMDDDKFKNMGIRLSQAVGSVFRVGGFYYLGKEKRLTDTADTTNLNYEADNEITYYGPDINMTVGPVELTAQYLVRKDTNPLFTHKVPDKEIETSGMVVEVIFSPQLDASRFYLTVLYNQIDPDTGFDSYTYETATLSGTYLLARNLRFTGEYTRDLDNKQNQFTIGLVSGF